MSLQLFIKVVLICQVISVPLEPGQQGGPWTAEEIDIVREKVIRMMQCGDENYPNNPNSCWRVPGLPDNLEDGWLDEYSRPHEDLGPRDERNGYPDGDPDVDRNNRRYKWKTRGVAINQLLQLSFHDCLRYEDGSGGCDGCLNWSGVGYVAPRALANIIRKKPQWYRAFPITRKTTNNKLQLAARSLELIFTVPNWPPGAGVLTTSLKESGKSRADLWQFAGNIALESAINRTNTGVCMGNEFEVQLNPSDDADKCEIKLNRPVPFRSGRIDCIPDESVKWTPYPFEATKTEKHSNTFGTGTQVVKDLKQDFDFTAQETISLMSLHGLARSTPNFEQFIKYKWIGGNLPSYPKVGILHRLYYKILNGKKYRHNVHHSQKYLNGDKNGNPVGGSGFWIDCKGQWNNTERKFPGPCHFRPTETGCSQSVVTNPDEGMTRNCFQLQSNNEYTLNWWTPGCDKAELVEKNGILYQVGGPLDSPENLCNTVAGHSAFMMPFEASFVLNFTVGEDNTPSGCGTLDGDWRLTNMRPINEPNHIYIGSPGYNGSPPCGANTYAPEGEALADIVALFARDHDAWQDAFFNAWEKMGINGYEKEMLTEGPSNGQLLAPFMPETFV